MSESFAELFEESLQTVDMEPGSIVTGVVIDIDNEWVTVHAGLKSEGVIPLDQFTNANGECSLSVGDEVQVALETVEDGFGETKLSREKAKRAEAWKGLEAAHVADEVVMGVINGKVKGGFTVDIDSIRAFLPGSLIDVRPIRETTHLEGKELEFKVIKLDQKRNNVVVSRRAVMESANSAEREELLEQMKRMRPSDMTVLETKSIGGGTYTLAIYAIKGDASDPDLRRYKLWKEYPDNLVIPSESVDCSAEEPVRVTRDQEAIYIRKLNPGGPVRATAREDHLVWWAACHPELAGQDPVSLTDKAKELGYSTLLIESQEVLRLPGG